MLHIFIRAVFCSQSLKTGKKVNCRQNINPILYSVSHFLKNEQIRNMIVQKNGRLTADAFLYFYTKQRDCYD